MGKIELIVFPQSYEKLAEKLKIDVPVVVRGALRGEEDAAPKLAVSAIQALEDVKMKLPEALRIKVPLHSPDAAAAGEADGVVPRVARRGKLLLDFEEPGEFCAVLEPSEGDGGGGSAVYRPGGGAGGARWGTGDSVIESATWCR